MPKKRTLTEFLGETRWRSGGVSCRTCEHPNRREIDAACKEFSEKRATGQTTMPWSVFLREYLAKDFGYRLKSSALKTHLENCCGTQR